MKSTKIQLCSTLRKYDKANLPKDLLAGVIIAAVSIPISMGYAQIAGLPAIYGLYGSVFPIIIFALFSTSPQFIFGVDAAPAALVGASLISLGIEGGSPQAMTVVPVITLLTALWLILFSVLKAGKLVNFISSPVMGGFITGICCTIILMQVPKLLGGSAGTGELIELTEHLIATVKIINIPSLLLGAGALAVLLLSKKFIPKFPMAIVVMVAGAVASKLAHLENYGIAMLSAVEPGLPKFVFPALSSVDVIGLIGISLPIAIVIMAETLLAENSFATKNGYKLNDNQEILAFGLGNLAAAFTGCCPINGSVSRTAMSAQYGGKTQLTGLTAGILMIGVLLFCTGFISWLPVPVLTAIVISALLGACEFHLAKKLWKVSHKEFYIFCAAFLGVLVLGTIYGVIIGIVLSFASVIIRSADPPRCFLGVSPGQDEFLNMEKFKYVYPIEGVIIYRFSSNLFFANAAIFQKDIENALREDTKVFIVDCSGVGNIDITAAERLEIIYKSMKDKGIKFYLTEHIAAVNDQLRSLGLGYMVEEGAVRRTIDIALKDAGYFRPYKLEGIESTGGIPLPTRAASTVQEFVWAFGEGANEQIEKQISKRMDELKKTGTLETIQHGAWQQMDDRDEEDWIEHLEKHIAEIARFTHLDEQDLDEELRRRAELLHKRIMENRKEIYERRKWEREIIEKHIAEVNPQAHQRLTEMREFFKNKQ